MKKGQIYAWHLEISEWRQSGSVHTYFNRSRINDFYSEYGLRLQSLQKEIQEHQEYFYEIEGDEATGKRIKIIENKPVLKEGRTQEDANQAWQDLMNQELVDKLKLIRP